MNAENIENGDDSTSIIVRIQNKNQQNPIYYYSMPPCKRFVNDTKLARLQYSIDEREREREREGEIKKGQ